MEGGNPTEGTYGTAGARTGDVEGGGVDNGGVEGEDVEGEDADDEGVEDVKRTLVVFRFVVRYPGLRGRNLTISPTSSFSK